MATLDLLDLDEARRAVNLPSPSTSDADDDLKLFVSGISGRIDELCGPVVQRTITDEKHDGGRCRILLDLQHVSSVTSVSEWAGTTETTLAAETNASKPASGYLLDPVGPYGFVYRRASNGDATFPAGRRNVLVTYVAGRYADTAAVDERFKLAASAVLRRVFKREQSSWAHTPDFFTDTENPRPGLMFYKAVDPMLIEFLADELLPPVGI